MRQTSRRPEEILPWGLPGFTIKVLARDVGGGAVGGVEEGDADDGRPAFE